MSMLWPSALLLLVLIPLLIAAYIWILRRRKRFTVRYSSLSLIRAALPKHTWIRRHLPFALFVLALASLIGALTRPVSIVSVPAGRTTIILAIDASRSMLADDIPPSRIDAAEAAALSFIRQQDSTTQIGIVAFAGFAELVQPPTSDQEALEKAIRSLLTGRGTAIGSSILRSLDVISEIDPSVAPSVPYGSTDEGPTPVPVGAYAPAIIVVLTDGVSTTGILPLDAAQQAADRGIRVYTIGFGTEQGGSNMGGNGWGGGNDWSGGGGFRRGIDEETLREVAELTGGEYYTAESSDELLQVFRDLPTSLIMRNEVTEISVFFVAAGVILALLAIVLALRWNPVW